MKIPDAAQPLDQDLGAELHIEPVDRKRHIPTFRFSHTMLSDIYYRVVQDGYYALEKRAWRLGDIGQQVMDYMAWATCSFDEYERLLLGREPRQHNKRPLRTPRAVRSRRRR